MPIGRRGRPGLVGTMARTAVISGTATAVSGNVARRQAAKAQPGAGDAAAQQQQWEAQQQWAAQQAAAAPQAAPPPAGGVTDDSIARLKELAELRDQGILTEDEFAAQKAKILA